MPQPTYMVPRVRSRIYLQDKNAAQDLSAAVAAALRRLWRARHNDLLILCIGTDRSTGDCLGPLVGSFLMDQAPRLPVRGTLAEPIHATNLPDMMRKLGFAPNQFIIAIDACLGKLDNVGSISVNDRPLLPGAGVSKQLPPVGQMHITGTVNVGGFMEYLVLQNTRLSLVMEMAQLITTGILNGCRGFLPALK